MNEIQPFTVFEIKTLCIARKMDSENLYNKPLWSSAAIQPLIDRVEKLEKVRSAASSLMSEDDAQEALSHYVVLQILRDALKEAEETP